jgi:hypothetical protein
MILSCSTSTINSYGESFLVSIKSFNSPSRLMTERLNWNVLMHSETHTLFGAEQTLTHFGLNKQATEDAGSLHASDFVLYVRWVIVISCWHLWKDSKDTQHKKVSKRGWFLTVVSWWYLVLERNNVATSLVEMLTFWHLMPMRVSIFEDIEKENWKHECKFPTFQ